MNVKAELLTENSTHSRLNDVNINPEMIRAITKEAVLDLIDRMITPDPEAKGFYEGTAQWSAWQEARNLTDMSLMPVLEDIIREHPGDEGRDVRKTAYFIYHKLLVHRFDEAGFAFLLGRLDKEITKGNAIWWVDYLEDIDVQPETPVHTLLSIALRGDTDDIKWISRIIEEYAAKGNIESRNALPALKERIKAASKTARQATADILKEHGVVSKIDMQRLSDEDSALLYEALKAGVIEEYGISHKPLDKLIGEILK